MRMATRFLCVSILMIMTYGIINAQGKIGYVDIMKIRSEFQEFKDAEGLFQKEMESVQVKIKNKETEIENKRKELDAQSLLLSEEKRREKEAAIQNLMASYQQTIQEEQSKAAQRESDLLAPIQQKLKIAIENVAKKEGFDYVLDVANTYYAKEAWDITTQVLRELTMVKLPSHKVK
ncbi:MAG: OmpH family outer membrane protein [Candidatus Delongbacteria bacterium]|nr:OmpH family outer membrane protein [Candidatus Delongbacteria bacterium]